jgi:hypothetical protein
MEFAKSYLWLAGTPATGSDKRLKFERKVAKM